MKISAKSDYACRALLELALHWPNEEPLSISAIADKQKIPLKFLTLILLQMKQLGYVESTRGKMGGYTLVVDPKTIKLTDVLRSFSGTGFLFDRPTKSKNTHLLDIIWQEINSTLVKTLDEINFEIIRNREKTRNNLVSFEI